MSVKIGRAIIPAVVKLADETFDLCSLDVPGLTAPAVVIGSVASLRPGQRVYAIGAPAGLELTISEGIVSALRTARIRDVAARIRRAQFASGRIGRVDSWTMDLPRLDLGTQQPVHVRS